MPNECVVCGGDVEGGVQHRNAWWHLRCWNGEKPPPPLLVVVEPHPIHRSAYIAHPGLSDWLIQCATVADTREVSWYWYEQFFNEMVVVNGEVYEDVDGLWKQIPEVLRPHFKNGRFYVDTQ